MANGTDIFQIEMFEQVLQISRHALCSGWCLISAGMAAMSARIPAIYPMFLLEHREKWKPFLMAGCPAVEEYERRSLA